MVYKIEQNGCLRVNPYNTARMCIKVALSKLNDEHETTSVLVAYDGHETVMPFNGKSSDDHERAVMFGTVFLDHPMGKEIVFKQPSGDIKIIKETNND